MELTADDCLRLLPELSGQALKIRELKGGITNRLYRVRSGGGMDYVFRFYGRKTELFIDREMEVENLRRLAPLGITPKVVRYLPEQGVTVVEFIPGTVLKNADFLNADLWGAIVAPIRTVHRSGLILPHRFDPLAEIRRLYKILEGLPSGCGGFDCAGTIRILEKISTLAAVSPSDYCPCHNDLLAENFILTENGAPAGGTMCLIDWEYGGMAPAHYDLADMFQEILVSDAVEEGLLSAYWEGADPDRHRYRTDLFKPFPDIYWFLWSLIQRNVSAIEFDYAAYGRTKYENARRNIARLRDRYGVAI